MNVVIIEDEQPARERLTELLKEIMPELKVLANHDSVESASKWLSLNEAPDLMLLDIQLADGTAFDLLKRVKIDCPVIFTTAYRKYALDAFKTTSVDYLLKPIKKEELENALLNLKEFKHIFSQQEVSTIQKSMLQPIAYKKRFIIRFGEHIKTLAVENIAYCISENKNTFARTFDGHKYPMDNNLDALEEMLDPQYFFRINRQFLINLKAIEEMKIYSKARVIVRLNPPVKDLPVVSSERAADFKLWLAGELPE
ncbi:MAG: response regulator transcription factor [Flavipsychrobacter sp.]|nr:response regulator transcription factor [Flavipsychrobacter sp.]